MQVQFDNTLSVKMFAKTKEAQSILNIPVGNDQQLFKIGDTVTSSEYSCIRLDGYNAKITGVERINGYYRYNAQYTRLKHGCKRKTEIVNDSFRQKDLILIK